MIAATKLGMRLTVLSFFRNSAHGQAQRFMRQVGALAKAWRGSLRLVAVYGDCVDRTADVLRDEAENWEISIQLVERSHGQPEFGSTESADRLKHLSWVANGGLDAINASDEVVLYVESDLIWTPPTILQLVSRVVPDQPDVLRDLERGASFDRVLRGEADIVAPLVFAGEAFYDIFMFRGLDGRRFDGANPPYHPDVKLDGTLTPVSSVGSCFVMTGSVARSTRIRNGQALLGFCEDARSKGYRIAVDASARVEHPI